MKIKRMLEITMLLVIIIPFVSNGKGKKDKEKFNMETDSLALVKLYEECNGPNWLHSDNWMTGPLSTWYGVTVGTGRIVGLELFNENIFPKFGLTGQIPIEIWTLDKLRILNLSSNLITLEIPPDIGKLEKLRVLDLSYSAGGIQGLIPLEIGNLKNLEILRIEYGRITGIPANISELDKLEIFSLRGNQANFDLSPIYGLKNIREIFLQENRFDELSMLENPNLERANLANNKFTFEDIIPNLTGRFVCNYFPQRSIVDYSEEFSINAGETIELTAHYQYEGCKYQWLKDGNIIDNATDSVYIASEGGEFTYLVSHDEAPQLVIPSFPKNVSIVGGNDPEIYAALEAFYNATNGDNWIRNDNWLTDKPFNEWYGIEIETWDNDFAINIILAENNLTGYIPAEIGDIPNLVKLELFINEINGEIPHEIGNLKRLTSLCLGDNQLSGELPDELFTLNTMHRLELGNNNFEGQISPLFANLTDLNFLYLNANNFTSEIPEELYTITALKELNLGDNSLGTDISSNIFNLINLEFFGIAKNQFRSIPDLSSMPKLTHLSVSANYLGFEHIIPMMGKFEVFDYNSQGMVDEPQTIEKLDWEPITLQASYLCDGAIYRWQRWSGTRWWDIEDENGPSIQVIYDSQYQYFVTHPEVPGLELKAYEKDVILTEGLYPAIYATFEAFYNATNGNNWNRNDNWLTEKPLTEWYGISSEEYKGETFLQIDLSSNNLTGYIPGEIGDIPNLKNLYLLDNNISGQIPPEIGKLNHLIDFYLGGNQMDGELPEELFSLANLGGLGLTGNNFEGTLSPLVGNLQKLMYLLIGGNQFHGELPLELYSLDLYEFMIGGNNFEGEINPEILNLSNLNFFDISNNQFTNIPDISSMPRMNHVGISSNYFDFKHIVPITSGTYETFGYSPQKTILDQPESFTINEGESIELIANYTYAGCTFQWYKDGNIINGATQTTFHATETGNYHYEVSHPDAPGLIIPSASKEVIVLTNKSAKIKFNPVVENLSMVNENALTVFPNPVKNTCTIKLSSKEQAHSLIELYDSQGRKCKLLYTGELLAGSINLNEDMSNYTSGLYFIRATINNQIIIKKLVKSE